MASKTASDKTNVMRILDKYKISYNNYYYGDVAIPGSEVAKVIGIDPNRVFKTLVLTSKSKKNYVFVVPVNMELDLQKAAKVVGEKNVEMLPMAELLGLTGYVHGGCSPIGMKKQFQTTIHFTANDFEKIVFSAGKIGCQVEISLEDLKKVIRIECADIVKE